METFNPHIPPGMDPQEELQEESSAYGQGLLGIPLPSLGTRGFKAHAKCKK